MRRFPWFGGLFSASRIEWILLDAWWFIHSLASPPIERGWQTEMFAGRAIHSYLALDNSDEGRALIAERTPEDSLVVHDARRWALIKGAKP